MWPLYRNLPLRFLTALALGHALGAHAFDLQGHRGARGTAPENTLTGFAAALTMGVATLELDTGVTRDGVVVIHHDRRLNPDKYPFIGDALLRRLQENAGLSFKILGAAG